MTIGQLDHNLCRFYAEARTKKGEQYSKSTLLGFHHSVERYLNAPHLTNFHWPKICKVKPDARCEQCGLMPTEMECVCCKELLFLSKMVEGTLWCKNVNYVVCFFLIKSQCKNDFFMYVNRLSVIEWNWTVLDFVLLLILCNEANWFFWRCLFILYYNHLRPDS